MSFIRIFLLTIATMIWGLGFVGTRWTLSDYSPIWSNGIRFLFAGIISIPILIFIKRPKRKLNSMFGPILCSIFLVIGLQLQTIGISQTSLAKSGFLTTFYAIFTPLLILLINPKRRFQKKFWLLLFCAIFGIALLCDLKFEQFNKGDWYILSSALIFSVHIILLDVYAKKFQAIELNCYQCIFMGILAPTFALIFEGTTSFLPLINFSQSIIGSPLGGFLILGIFSSVIAFGIQVYAQQGIPPHIVGVIFLLESIFATIFGYVFFNETISTMGLIGCIIVLVSVGLVPFVLKHKEA